MEADRVVQNRRSAEPEQITKGSRDSQGRRTRPERSGRRRSGGGKCGERAADAGVADVEVRDGTQPPGTETGEQDTLVRDPSEQGHWLLLEVERERTVIRYHFRNTNINPH